MASSVKPRLGLALLLVLVLGLSASVLIACQLLAGIEERSVRPADGAAGGTGAAVDAGSDAPLAVGLPDACSSIGAPLPPIGATDDNVDRDLIFALSHIDFGLDGGLENRGLNLDKTCTCPQSDSCIRPLGTDGSDAGAACDGVGGVDNAVSSAIAQLTVFNLVSEDQLNQNLRDGISGGLIRVQGWGGAANDPNVVVSMYNALKFDGTSRPTGKPDDAWVVDEQGISDLTQMRSIYRDDNAYETNGTLVAKVSFPLEIGGNAEQAPLRLDLKDGLLVARINLETGEIRGVIGGRWPMGSILSTIETFRDPGVSGRNVCRDTASFAFMRDFVCTRADIQASSGLDFSGSSCNALSTLIGFEGRRARFGKHSTRPTVRTSCEAGLPPLNCN